MTDTAGTRRQRSERAADHRPGGAEERARLQAVHRYAALGAAPDEVLDRVVELAARFFAVPIAAIAFVDERRILFIAQCGLDGLHEIPREPGLCASAILQWEPYLVSDAAGDPRTSGNRLVRGAPGVRFYAAAPIATPDGHRLGTVSVMDGRPRQATQEELGVLRDLAALVASTLDLRLSASRAVEAERRLRAQLEREKALLEQIAALEADLATQLQHALTHRIAIEQAKGMLMAWEGLDEQAAFQRLRAVARSRRRSVEEIAARVLAGEPLPAPLRSAKERRRPAPSGQRRRRPAPGGRADAVPTFSDGILRITPMIRPPGLRLEGEVDQSNSKALADALAAATAALPGDLHLELAGLEFIHVEGLRLLVQTATQLPPGRQLVLHGLAPYLHRIMELVGWDQPPGLRFARARSAEERGERRQG